MASTPFELKSSADQVWNLDIDGDGRLAFKANNPGETRMMIHDDSGQITVGGSGEFGQLQLVGPTGANTIFIGAEGSDATATLGGGSGLSGRVYLQNAAGLRTIAMEGSSGSMSGGSLNVGVIPGDPGTVDVRDESGSVSIQLTGSRGNIDAASVHAKNATGLAAIEMEGSESAIYLGAKPHPLGIPGTAGHLYVRDRDGNLSILLEGTVGDIAALSFTELDVPIAAGSRTGSAPIANALNTVLALHGVRYQWTHEGIVKKAFGQDARLGFIAQEVETVCPEVVSTDAEGHKSLQYSRLIPVLVEAMKEQQQLITQQAAALGEALEKIAQLNASMQGLQA